MSRGLSGRRETHAHSPNLDGASVTADGEPAPMGTAAIVAGIAIMVVALNLRPAVVAVAPLVDEIKHSMAWDSGIAGLLTTLPLLLFGVTALFAAKCAARFGVERTVFVSLIVLCIGVAIRFWPNTTALLVGSTLVGAGIGICNVVLPALIKRDFANHSGLMTGLYSMMLSAGGAIAAGLAVPVNTAVGGNWSLALALWGLPVLAAIVMWSTQLRRSHHIVAGPVSGSLWRNGLAWAITILMGSQSLVFFAFGSWLPDMLTDRGMTSAAAGAVLAVGSAVALILSLVAPVVAGLFRDQRAVALAAVLMCAIGFVGIISTSQRPLLWVILVMSGPGALLGLSLLFMVRRSVSTAQAGQVSGMAQSVGYFLAAAGPVVIGAVHDATRSWSVAMGALALALIPQAVAAWASGQNRTMTDDVAPSTRAS